MQSRKSDYIHVTYIFVFMVAKSTFGSNHICLDFNRNRTDTGRHVTSSLSCKDTQIHLRPGHCWCI